LIAELLEDGEKPWATYNRGKSITPRQLAKLLAGYGIQSKTVRFGASTPKGYELSQFADAFARYLGDPENLPQRRNDGPEASPREAGGVADADSVAATPAGDETPEPMPGLGRGGVADFLGDGAGACPGLTPPVSKPEDRF
jgi:putative DNA primase/helicase